MQHRKRKSRIIFVTFEIDGHIITFEFDLNEQMIGTSAEIKRKLARIKKLMKNRKIKNSMNINDISILNHDHILMINDEEQKNHDQNNIQITQTSNQFLHNFVNSVNSIDSNDSVDSIDSNDQNEFHIDNSYNQNINNNHFNIITDDNILNESSYDTNNEEMIDNDILSLYGGLNDDSFEHLQDNSFPNDFDTFFL